MDIELSVSSRPASPKKWHLETRQIPEAFSNTGNQEREGHKTNFKCIWDAVQMDNEDRELEIWSATRGMTGQPCVQKTPKRTLQSGLKKTGNVLISQSRGVTTKQ